VSAVGYCHFRGLLHRDLKPENILLNRSTDGTLTPKLADFGLSTPVPNGQLISGLAGSPFYMAPEVISGDAYGSSADMWSLGVILYIMLSGKQLKS
jgi:calcium/calmodulin-dependent protein kinase I